MLEISPALRHAPLVARLVLGRDQRMGTAALLGCQIEVAVGAPDALFDMRSSALHCFQAPLHLVGINEEVTQAATIGAPAFERIGPRPILRGFQRQSDTSLQMIEARLAQPLDGWPSVVVGSLGKDEGGRNQDIVHPVCSRPGQQVRERPR
jgi:hypothetical protein